MRRWYVANYVELSTSVRLLTYEDLLGKQFYQTKMQTWLIKMPRKKHTLKLLFHLSNDWVRGSRSHLVGWFLRESQKNAIFMLQCTKKTGLPVVVDCTPKIYSMNFDNKNKNAIYKPASENCAKLFHVQNLCYSLLSIWFYC